MILLVDNYDSFVYNLYQYIGEALANIKNMDLSEKETQSEIYNEIKVIRNDELSVDEIKELNPDCIILSPGPGKPENAGICEELVSEFVDKEIPILGICLGHQAICQTLGSKIVHAKQLMHGKTSDISLNDNELFKGISGKTTVARYHSLAVDVESVSEDLEIIAKTDENEIMGVKHKNAKIYGLQFHPESILTQEGMKIIENFLKINS